MCTVYSIKDADFSPLVGKNQTTRHQSNRCDPGCKRKVPWSTYAKPVRDAFKMFSFILNPLKRKAPISRFFLLIRGSQRWSELALNMLLSHMRSLPLVLISSTSSLLSSVNWAFISHIQSTVTGERLSSSARGRNWRWLYWWSAPWISSTCNKKEWQQVDKE